MALTGNASVIASFFSGKGLSAAGVAGILGTWQAESGLNPGITNSIGAHGFAQWLGVRRQALQRFAASMGTNENNISAQLEFAWLELQQPQYSGLLQTLRTTNDPRAAAQAFVNIFERPGPGGDPGAPGFAATFFAGGVPGGKGGGTTGNTVSTQGITSGGGGSGGSNSNLPWESLFFGPLGSSIAAVDPKGFQTISDDTGVTGIVNGIKAFVDTFVNLLGLIALIFKPSNWLRIVSFLIGVVCLIGGLVMLKGAAL